MTLEDITEAHIADLKAAGVVDFVKISALKNELKGLKEKMKNLDAKLNEKSSNLEDTAKKLQNILEIFEAIKNNNSEISTEIAQNLALAESDIKAEGERLNERKAILPEQLEEAKSDLKLKLEEAEQTFRNAQKAFSTEVLQNNLVFMSKIKAIQDRTETLGKSFDTEQVVEKYMKKIGSDKKEGFLKSLGVGEGDLKSFLTALSLKENPKPAIVNPVSETQEAA
jgi:hypothetical protein